MSQVDNTTEGPTGAAGGDAAHSVAGVAVDTVTSKTVMAAPGQTVADASSDISAEEAARQAVAEAAHLASVPDAFQRLWTPHRMVYIAQGQSQPAAHECPFCDAPEHEDAETLIVHRGQFAYALLNLFPYNSGHLLVCPYRHISLYDEADADETREIASITQTAMRVVREVAGCDGFNIGMNQGAIAGAGIASHLHQHVVPRWAGDANFLPIIAGTKALPQLLGEMREQIASAWPAER